VTTIYMLLLQANTTGLFNLADLQLIVPELILTVCACVALVMEVVLPYRKSKLIAYFSLVGIALAGLSLGVQFWSSDALPLDGFYGMIRIDGFALVVQSIFLIGAALAIAISTRYLDIEGEQHGEYYALVLFATVGMMFLGCGFDLITLYISLELMALTFYVLVAFTKREKRSNEAAMKYFLLGAFSSGVLLYGMSLLYGIAGSTNLGEIGSSVAQIATTAPAAGEASLRPMLLLGMIALAAGLFFKIAAVPFHMWAPDAYEGAPTSVTAFLSTASKAASFALYRSAKQHASGLGAAAGFSRRDHNHGGKLGGSDAGKLETAAGILFDLKRGLSIAGVSRGKPLRLCRAGNLFAGLHVHEHGCVWHHHQPAATRNHRR